MFHSISRKAFSFDARPVRAHKRQKLCDVFVCEGMRVQQKKNDVAERGAIIICFLFFIIGVPLSTPVARFPYLYYLICSPIFIFIYFTRAARQNVRIFH